MRQGYVKWFNDAKGYGFIACADAAGDIFVHFSAIVMSGYKRLETDMQVMFDLVETPKGLMAQNVQPLDLDAPPQQAVIEPEPSGVEPICEAI